MKDRRTVSRADYEQVSEDLAHALAEIGMLEAELAETQECELDLMKRDIKANDEIQRLLVLKKACEDWMDICGCCCENDTESVHDGTRITRLGIKDALAALGADDE